MRQVRARAGLVVATLLAGWSSGAHATNVLLVVLDDVGVDKVDGFADYGAVLPEFMPVTPTLTALQDAGVSFDHAWASPMCSPTRAALQTGAWSFQNGVGSPLRPSDAGPVDADWETLGESAQAVGAATGLFGKWHVGNVGSDTDEWDLGEASSDVFPGTPPPIEAGYDVFVGSLEGAVDDYDNWALMEWPGPNAPDTDMWIETTWPDDVVVEQATSWINDQSGPWLASVNFFSPHTERTTGYDESELSAEACPGDPCVADGSCPDTNASGGNGDEIAKIVYRDLVECLDDRVEALLEGIDPATLEDTVVVLIGDNGTVDRVQEGDYADPGPRAANGKGSVYQSGVHVPLIVTDGGAWLDLVEGRAPTSDLYPSPGARSSVPVATIDLHDTALGYLGTARGSTQASRSLVPLVRAGLTELSPAALARRRQLVESFNNDWETEGVTPDAELAWLAGTRWKLVLNTVSDGSGGVCLERELYDLEADPHEWTDLAPYAGRKVEALYAEVLELDPPWLPELCP